MIIGLEFALNSFAIKETFFSTNIFDASPLSCGEYTRTIWKIANLNRFCWEQFYSVWNEGWIEMRLNNLMRNCLNIVGVIRNVCVIVDGITNHDS